MASVPGLLRAADTLAIWERVASLGPGARAIDRALLLASFDGDETAALSAAPVGRCYAKLLGLRLRMGSNELDGIATCPHCADPVEFAVNTIDFLALDTPGEKSAELVFSRAGYTVHGRPPAPIDLIGLDEEADPVAALRRRCLVANDADGNGLDPATLPDDILDEIDLALAAADPLAELVVSLRCPDCEVGFDADVDLGAFVWSEVDARAQRILHDVDILARAYGWTEPDVLALSESRRAAYLNLVLEGAP